MTRTDGHQASVRSGDGPRKVVRTFGLNDLLTIGETEPLPGEVGVVAEAGPSESPVGRALVDLTRLFFGSVHSRWTGSDETVRTVLVRPDRDSLTLETDHQLIACDLQLGGAADPFEVDVPSGTFPVLLAWTDRRVAAALLRFGEGPPDRWEPAWTVRDDPRTHAYGVDSGRGCFADGEAFGRRRVAGSVVSFPSGMGDGGYESYLGYAGDELVGVATDFGMLYERRPHVLRFPGVRAFASGALESPTLVALGIAVTFENFARSVATSRNVGSTNDTARFELTFDEPPGPGAVHLSLRATVPLVS